MTPLLARIPSRVALSILTCSLLGSSSAAASEPAPASAVTPPSSPPPTPPTASVPHPHAYGILVGTNTGGAGQTELRYAEDDAQRMAQVLKDLGRYGTTDMRVLLRPDSARVLATIEEVGAKLRAHQAKGEQATSPDRKRSPAAFTGLARLLRAPCCDGVRPRTRRRVGVRDRATAACPERG